MKTIQQQLNGSWATLLSSQFEQSYMQQLQAFLAAQQQQGQIIYPPNEQIFAAFTQTPFEQVKVVILGQDPYHGTGEAHGLSFSVPPSIKIPPSLRNIYKELQQDLGVEPAPHGHLQAWAQQGVLLLNTVLTVNADQAGSHQKQGWELFTDKVIELLDQQGPPKVFILWGNHAQKKGRYINSQKHLLLKSAHPSPLSVRHGFYGSKPFSQTNNWLIQQGQTPINWQLDGEL